MPAARLQSIPFPQPQRFIALLDEDLSVIEPGLRLAARDVPLPEDAGGGTIEALCADASGKAVALKIVEKIEPRELFDALAARAWLHENLPTLRSVCPALAGGVREARSLVLAARIDPAAVALLAPMNASAPDMYLVDLFQTSSGIAVHLRRVTSPIAERTRRVAPSAGAQASSAATTDPLSGIPLSTEEAAEFRRLAAEASPRPSSRPDARTSAPVAQRQSQGSPAPPSAFLEN